MHVASVLFVDFRGPRLSWSSIVYVWCTFKGKGNGMIPIRRSNYLRWMSNVYVYEDLQSFLDCNLDDNVFLRCQRSSMLSLLSLSDSQEHVSYFAVLVAVLLLSVCISFILHSFADIST